jgi:hypothetical protein
MGRAAVDPSLTVAIGGDSLVLAAVRESLEQAGRFRVIRVDANAADAGEALAAGGARALIVDLDVLPVTVALALLRACPDMALVGLDPAGRVLLALSGQRVRSLRTDDLVHLIEQELVVPLGSESPESVASEGQPLGVD